MRHMRRRIHEFIQVKKPLSLARTQANGDSYGFIQVKEAIPFSFCFCKNNKRTIIMYQGWSYDDCQQSSTTTDLDILY